MTYTYQHIMKYIYTLRETNKFTTCFCQRTSEHGFHVLQQSLFHTVPTRICSSLFNVVQLVGCIGFRENDRNSEIKVDMGGSGDPAQTNIMAARGAHTPDCGRTPGGRTAKQFDFGRKKYKFAAHYYLFCLAN